MTMIPSGPSYRIRALSASAIVRRVSLFGREGASAIPELPREKKRRRNVFIKAIRCNPQVVAIAGRSPSLAASFSNFLLAARELTF